MNTVPAVCGWNWVRTGFALFRKNPAMWALLVFSYIVLMQLLGRIPVLGWFAATVLIPAFTASFMIVSRDLDQGRKLRYGSLFSGFRSNLPALLRQGGLYLACALAILALSALADGGLLLRLARARPDCQFTGIEHAPLTWLLAKLRSLGRPNVTIRHGDFWAAPLTQYAVVYAFLSPAPMPRLWVKACTEMAPNALLVSNSFAVPGIEPASTTAVADRRNTRLFLYHPGQEAQPAQ